MYLYISVLHVSKANGGILCMSSFAIAERKHVFAALSNVILYMYLEFLVEGLFCLYGCVVIPHLTDRWHKSPVNTNQPTCLTFCGLFLS